jgi:hypothetical protein
MNAGKKKDAVSEYCAPMKNPYIPIPETAVVAFWFKRLPAKLIRDGNPRLPSNRVEPPKATIKPYTRHILGIDSGEQRHPKATPMRPSSHPKAILKAANP